MTPRRAHVVVSTYDRPEHLRRALAAWRRQTFQDFALFVADDGSPPETRAIVEAFARAAPFPVEHVWQPHDGFRKARVVNEAVRRAGGEPLLVLTDADCVPPADHLARHAAAHGPRTVAVAGAYSLEEPETAALTVEAVERGEHEALRRPDDARRFRRRAWRTRWDLLLGRHLRALGLNLGIDRSLFEEANGYDEAFEGWGREDDDLADRLMALRPRPRVRNLYGTNETIHLWHPPVASKSERKNEAYYRSPRPARCVRGLVPPAS